MFFFKLAEHMMTDKDTSPEFPTSLQSQIPQQTSNEFRNASVNNDRNKPNLPKQPNDSNDNDVINIYRLAFDAYCPRVVLTQSPMTINVKSMSIRCPNMQLF